MNSTLGRNGFGNLANSS